MHNSMLMYILKVIKLLCENNLTFLSINFVKLKFQAH